MHLIEIEWHFMLRQLGQQVAAFTGATCVGVEMQQVAVDVAKLALQKVGEMAPAFQVLLVVFSVLSRSDSDGWQPLYKCMMPMLCLCTEANAQGQTFPWVWTSTSRVAGGSA